jgi:hypothetical protein
MKEVSARRDGRTVVILDLILIGLAVTLDPLPLTATTRLSRARPHRWRRWRSRSRSAPSWW